MKARRRCGSVIESGLAFCVVASSSASGVVSCMESCIRGGGPVRTGAGERRSPTCMGKCNLCSVVTEDKCKEDVGCLFSVSGPAPSRVKDVCRVEAPSCSAKISAKVGKGLFTRVLCGDVRRYRMSFTKRRFFMVSTAGVLDC